MAGIYDRFVSLADRLIKKYGTTVTVIQPGEVAGSKSYLPQPDNDAETEVQMVFLNEKRKDWEPVLHKIEDLVAEGKIYALMPAVTGLTLNMESLIKRDDDTLYKIRYLRPFNAAAQLVYWKIGIGI